MKTIYTLEECELMALAAERRAFDIREKRIKLAIGNKELIAKFERLAEMEDETARFWRRE